VALRRKTAGNEWGVLDAQSNRPLGRLTPEIEGNLQQLLAALTEMLQKRAAVRAAAQFAHLGFYPCNLPRNARKPARTC